MFRPSPLSGNSHQPNKHQPKHGAFGTFSDPMKFKHQNLSSFFVMYLEPLVVFCTWYWTCLLLRVLLHAHLAFFCTIKVWEFWQMFVLHSPFLFHTESPVLCLFIPTPTPHSHPAVYKLHLLPFPDCSVIVPMHCNFLSWLLSLSKLELFLFYFSWLNDSFILTLNNPLYDTVCLHLSIHLLQSSLVTYQFL